MQVRPAENINCRRNKTSREFMFVPTVPNFGNLRLLVETNKIEVFEFLLVRPVHTVVMTSFIRDNDLESADNRGQFYGYQNSRGKLEEATLPGLTTLIESRLKEFTSPP